MNTKPKIPKTGVLEELGLDRVRKLSIEICLRRVRYLRRGIRHNRYEGELLNYAKYYANWYRYWASKCEEKQA